MNAKNIAIVALALVAVVGWVAYIRKNPVTTVPKAEALPSRSVMQQTLGRRHSTLREEFSRDPVSSADLTLLSWAASGKNRDGAGGYTVPLAMGSDPYVDIYIFDERGTRVYDPQSNELHYLGHDDERATGIMRMEELQDIPAIMVFVIDPDHLPGQNPDETYGYIAVGAMSQNVYLMAETLGIQARYIASIDSEAVTRVLQLEENDIPVGAMLLAQGDASGMEILGPIAQ